MIAKQLLQTRCDIEQWQQEYCKGIAGSQYLAYTGLEAASPLRMIKGSEK